MLIAALIQPLFYVFHAQIVQIDLGHSRKQAEAAFRFQREELWPALERHLG
jgi:hypothetical protein